MSFLDARFRLSKLKERFYEAKRKLSWGWKLPVEDSPVEIEKKIILLNATIEPLSREEMAKEIKQLRKDIFRYSAQVGYGWYVDAKNLPENLDTELGILNNEFTKLYCK